MIGNNMQWSDGELNRKGIKCWEILQLMRKMNRKTRNLQSIEFKTQKRRAV